MKTNSKKYDECAICQQKIPSDKFEGLWSNFEDLTKEEIEKHVKEENIFLA